MDQNFLGEAILHQMKKEIGKIIEEEAQKAATEVIKRVSNLTDQIALNILSRYSIESYGHQIVIRVHKELKT